MDRVLSNNSLKKISVDRGLVVTIAAAASVRGAIWNDADNIIYAATGTTPLSSVPASGGTPHSLTTLNPQQHERTHRLPSLLPDGKTVLFNVGTLASPEDYDDATIEAVRLDTGERKVVLQGGRMPTYMANGDLLYVRGTVLYAVAFDPRRLEVHGRARPIIDGVLGDRTTGVSFFAVSDSGVLAYVPGNPSPSARQLAWVEPGGKTTPIDLPPALYTELHPSPDGMRLAFSVVVEGSRNRDVWVADPARGTSSRLTIQGTNWTPIWSPDGQRVFSVSYDGEKNRSTVEVRAADGTVMRRNRRVRWRRVSRRPDSGREDAVHRGQTRRRLAYLSTGIRGWRRQPASRSADPDSCERLEPLNLTRRALARLRDRRSAQKREVYVQSMEAGGGRVQIIQDDGAEPHWSADGRELYVLNDKDELVRGAARSRPGADAGTSAPAVDQCPAAGDRIRADLQRRSQKRSHPGDANDRRTAGDAAGALHAERVHRRPARQVAVSAARPPRPRRTPPVKSSRRSSARSRPSPSDCRVSRRAAAASRAAAAPASRAGR